jgi:hypothetical protein
VYDVKGLEFPGIHEVLQGIRYDVWCGHMKSGPSLRP